MVFDTVGAEGRGETKRDYQFSFSKAHYVIDIFVQLHTLSIECELLPRIPNENQQSRPSVLTLNTNNLNIDKTTPIQNKFISLFLHPRHSSTAYSYAWNVNL